jgi:hypothetical protein
LVCDYFYRHHVSLFINTHAAGEILADGPRKEVGVECSGDNPMPMLTTIFSVYEKYNACARHRHIQHHKDPSRSSEEEDMEIRAKKSC